MLIFLPIPRNSMLPLRCITMMKFLSGNLLSLKILTNNKVKKCMCQNGLEIILLVSNPISLNIRLIGVALETPKASEALTSLFLTFLSRKEACNITKMIGIPRARKKVIMNPNPQEMINTISITIPTSTAGLCC